MRTNRLEENDDFEHSEIEDIEHHQVDDVAHLEMLYASPSPKVAAKVKPGIGRNPRLMIENSRFVVLATVGSTGIETSGRGGPPGFVQVEDEQTLFLPDLTGNNRIDSLRNIVKDSRVGLLFLSPDHRQILRVKGNATISVDSELMLRFQNGNRLPKSVLIINVTACIIQCASTKMRAGMWSPPKEDREWWFKRMFDRFAWVAALKSS